MTEYPDNPGPLPAEKLGNPGDSEEARGALGNEASGKMYYSGGDKKELVTTVQKMLLALLFDIGDSGPEADGVDGIFGKKTEDAVKEFQKEYKDWDGDPLKVDGLVGPHTADALNRAMVGQWYDHYQTPAELVDGKPYHAVTSDFLKNGLSIEPGGSRKARVFVAGPIPWAAKWDRPGEPAKMGDERKMILTAPGLTAGTALVFTVLQECGGKSVKVAEVRAESREDGAEAAFSGWYSPKNVTSFTQARENEGKPIPPVTFKFEVNSDGNQAVSKALPYADRLGVRLVTGENKEGLANTLCTVYSPWGQFEYRTDANGALSAEGLPPGGISLGIDGRVIHIEPEQEAK